MQATRLARPRWIAMQGIAMHWALYLGPWLGLAGCRTMPPTDTWVTALESGLREPAGTFATFRAAFCAGVPELEYRCLSREFRLELGIDSQLVYREGRDELLREEPMLPRLLAAAQVERVDPLGPREARVVARSFGRTILVSMVRVDFWEISADGTEIDGDYVEDARDWMRVVEDEHGEPVLAARIPLATVEDGRAANGLELGGEWKIDGLEVLEPGAEEPPPPSSF